MLETSNAGLLARARSLSLTLAEESVAVGLYDSIDA